MVACWLVITNPSKIRNILCWTPKIMAQYLNDYLYQRSVMNISKKVISKLNYLHIVVVFQSTQKQIVRDIIIRNLIFRTFCHFSGTRGHCFCVGSHCLVIIVIWLRENQLICSIFDKFPEIPNYKFVFVLSLSWKCQCQIFAKLTSLSNKNIKRHFNVAN